MVQSCLKFPSSLQLVPVTRIETLYEQEKGTFSTKKMEDKEDHREPLGDDEEVVLSVQNKGADALGPYGPVIKDPPADRRSEWLFETEPHQWARPKRFDERRLPVELDQAMDSKLVTSGGNNRPEYSRPRYPGTEVTAGTTNSTRGRDPDANEEGTTSKWRSTAE